MFDIVVYVCFSLMKVGVGGWVFLAVMFYFFYFVHSRILDIDFGYVIFVSLGGFFICF